MSCICLSTLSCFLASGLHGENPYVFPDDRNEKVSGLEKQQDNLKILSGLIVAWWFILILFNDFPQLDTSFQSYFFSPAECLSSANTGPVCGAFPFSQHWFLVGLRRIFFWLPPVIAMALVAYILFSWRDTDNPATKENVHQVLLVVTSWVLCVGFLVNFILKAYSGRPRPVNTDLFGGLEHFIPAGGFGGTCQSNCSFISGEAASAGWLICLIPILPAGLRPVLAPILIVVSLATSFLRITFGGHYLSDVLLGWLSAPLIFFALVCLFGWKTNNGKA